MKVYKEKLTELRGIIERKLKALQPNVSSMGPGGSADAVPDMYDVFISYCWDNSRMAIHAKGVAGKESAFGLVDPRELKEFFVQNKLVCWLDCERTGMVLYKF